MSSMWQCSLAIIGGYAVVAFSSLATAQQQAANQGSVPANTAVSGQAEDAFWQGKRSYEAGDFEKAREQFQRAYDLVDDPSLLYNIAQSYRQLGDCLRAREGYRQFISRAADSPFVENAQKQLRALETSCSSEQTLPQPGVTTPQVSPSATAAARPPMVARPLVLARRDFRLEDSSASRHASVGYWSAGLLAGGVAAGVAAGALALWNQQRYSTWQERDRNLETGTAPDESDEQWAARQGENDRLWRSINGANRVAAVLGVGAGAMVATAAVLHFTLDRKDDHPAQANAVACVLTVGGTNGGLGWALKGRF